MAIIDMNEISLIGLYRDREEILQSLMEFGAIHITDIRDELPEQLKSALVDRNETEAEIQTIEDNIQKVSEVLKLLEKFDKRKKGLFGTRLAVSKEAYERVVNEQGLLWTTIKSIMWCDSRIEQLHSERNKHSNLIIALSPWEQLHLPLEKTTTRTTQVVMGYIPRRSNMEELQGKVDELGACQLLTLNRDREHIYICLLYHRSVSGEASAVLKQYGFTKVPLVGMEGTPEQNIQAAHARIVEIDRECERISKDMEDYAEDIEQLEILYDVLNIQRDLKRAEDRLAETRSVFMLRGWIPAHLSGTAVQMLQKRWICEVHIRIPNDDEEYPVLLKNNSLGQSVEAITSLYSLPHPKEYDPNTIVGAFFVLFFGLMMGDAGYGFLIILAALLLKKAKLEEGMQKFTKLMLYCGISTVFWGAMFGGWFGLPQMGKYPLFLNPIEQPELFLGFALLMGVIHIYTGLGMNSIKLIREKKYLDILLDVVVWYVFFTGFIFFVLPYAYNGNPELVGQLMNAGKYMLFGSGIIIVLTHGRKNKSFIKRLTSGIGSLYGVVKFLSDVLSYSRLMALGLATSVIGIIVYDIASMNGLDHPFAIVFFTFVMLAGHALNFAIALLSAYVHSSRLQYIEFYSRFFIGGGKLFKPFRPDTKYINLQEVMQSGHSIFGHDR